MAIRIRNVNGKLVALCAAETKLEPGDLYFDDVVDAALRRKFLEDYKKEGLIEAQAEPSEAELEEFYQRMARDIARWFRNWREQFPEENKDHEELPLNNAKNIVSIMLKKYRELLRRG